ncbi:tRNA methyltransferase 44 [Entomortierella chlamydospora]|uniref:tRNA (uracil-O(2)-)-methyltransferase n=1 Tax=Entomortierella chlamydospora TaxID=101097 RepID=A0A9P6N5J7_9FUNG|nr:tRNA methyltransferase 44 [Entomortierella chlamydospora]KAG0023961.1 tRNA methyltransferase 44 [Entomortierella chlamydospora]
MSGEESSNLEFTFDPIFYFENLPNNQGQTRKDGGVAEVTQPKWYQAAKAPVPFNEDVFWKVMERWVLEAPSIIPPISKVDIIHDHELEQTQKNGEMSNLPVSAFTTEREQLLLESKPPFRSIRRRLLPKRANKDPIMEEQLYYVRSQYSKTEATEQPEDEAMIVGTKSHAIFSPVIDLQSAKEQVQSEIEAMTTKLPFYYPKVRGFRYGFVPDQEDDEDIFHHHGEEEESQFEKGRNYEYIKDENYQEQPNIDRGSGTGGKTKSTTLSKRAGWITLDLFLVGDEGEFTDKMQYAFKELFRKLYKWGVNTTKGFTKSRVQHDVMVPKELYLETYARLKDKHAQKWVQSWPEKTDPRKFVFEDIAIASWLVALWELERKRNHDSSGGQQTKKQTFVDLGCGNGLLTHILNQEGHEGKGIDIASRKVWEVYGSTTRVEARTIIPNETTFDNVDWIIGNHADELAPWIPIIAMRSKPLTSRYQFPKGAPEGKYKAYQDYICSIINTCGYSLETEILRIPSTKNVALVGMALIKENGQEQKQHKCEEVDDLVRRSGVFVARVSDKEKQALQKSKQAAKQQTREHEEGQLTHKENGSSNVA